MAFRDIERVLYDGSVRLTYQDKNHMYFKQDRVNYELPEDDDKAWGKKTRPKGTTTLLGDTLEKKGLMTWPMGLALRELFGFYDFTNDYGKKMTGFSKDIGTLWDGDKLIKAKREELLESILSASKAWQRKQKKGADIGSVVHDAIEHYIHNEPFDIAESYLWNIKDAYPIPAPGEKDEFEAERTLALEEMPGDVKQAELAFDQFVTWWIETQPELVEAEDLIYSKKHNVSGTFDALIKIDGKLIMADWKTSTASKSKAAAAPQGIYYSYFIQSALYAMAWHEMGHEMVDDISIVSCRKDGGFDVIFASDLGLTVKDCIEWAESAIHCYQLMDKSKRALVKMGKDKLITEGAK